MDANEELVSAWLSQHGYLVASHTLHPLAGENARLDKGDIDVLAVRLGDNRVTETIIGAVRGTWTDAGRLTRAAIREYDLGKIMAQARAMWICRQFGITDAFIVRRVLYHTLPALDPAVRAEAEALLASLGIEVVYLDRIVRELSEYLRIHPLPALSASVEMLRVLRTIKASADA